MPTVIKIESLSKKYIIGRQKQVRYLTLREEIADNFRRLGNKLWHPFSGRNSRGESEQEEIWALKNVSLEINQGERVGIIGRNGAGKTTLLKILSRITEPTEGCVRIKGRVASLLEVGTGFHNELTGRENIYLNGAILGMRRAEISRKFDEIVAFAEVEKFIDTPVKRYSSGMYVRLAFAVAASLEQEILLVDEVLAVGDAAFQKKCLGKMGEAAQEGRTILFVSHNMAAVHRLCSRCVFLDGGNVVFDGATRQTVAKYLALGLGSAAEKNWRESERSKIKTSFLPLRACVRNSDGEITQQIFCTETITVEFDYMLGDDITDLRIAVMLFTAVGEWVFLSYDKDNPKTYLQQVTPKGCYRSTCYIPPNFLNEGQYTIGFYGGTGLQGRIWEELQVLSITTNIGYGVGSYWPANQERMGPVRPLLKWETSRID